MDIKLICNCGTKYEFDVEPVHGRMPAPVNCPSCGADGTALANEYIQRSLAPAPTPSPARAPAPIRVTVPPLAPALRINRPASPPPPESPPDDPGTEALPQQTVAGDAAAAPIAGRPPRRIAPASRADAEPKGRVVQVLTLIVSTVLIVFGAWKFGDKWFRRLGIVSDIARAAGEASLKDATEPQGAKNLRTDNCSIAFIRTTNDYQVADACQQYWKEEWNKKVMVINSPKEATENGEYELTSAYNGYVSLLGSHEKAYPELEGLA